MGHRLRIPVAALGVISLLATMAATPVAGQGTTAPQVSTTPATEVITLGAHSEVFRDGCAGAEQWGTQDSESGSIQYVGGGFRFHITTPSAKWSWDDLDTEAPVQWVRAAVDIAVDGGAAGPMCGITGTTPSFIFGVVNTEGEWVVGRTMETVVSVLARGPLPVVVDLAQGGRAVVSLECAMTGDAADRIALWVDGMNVADVSLPEAAGPFSRVGLFGEGYVPGFEVTMDDVVVATGVTYEPLVRAPESLPPVR